MSRTARPKTAIGGQQASLIDVGDLPAGVAGGGMVTKRPGSQMSLRSARSGGGAHHAGDESCWPQYVPVRRIPSAMRKSMEVQTEVGNQPPGAAADQSQAAPLTGAALFYPYYVPGLQDPATSAAAASSGQQQPFILLSPWQLPGYQNLPVLDASQLNLLDPVVNSRCHQSAAHPLDGAPIYRSGRNGSCWRHVKQCTGNLGNNIMFIDGHVKEEDCRRFPPHGYPGSSTAGLSVHSRLAPKAQPKIAQLGFPLGYPGSRQPAGSYQSQALERARAGTKYWFEDKKHQGLVPNTIQGRIMKSGSAY